MPRTPPATATTTTASPIAHRAAKEASGHFPKIPAKKPKAGEKAAEAKGRGEGGAKTQSRRMCIGKGELAQTALEDDLPVEEGTLAAADVPGVMDTTPAPPPADDASSTVEAPRYPRVLPTLVEAERRHAQALEELQILETEKNTQIMLRKAALLRSERDLPGGYPVVPELPAVPGPPAADPEADFRRAMTLERSRMVAEPDKFTGGNQRTLDALFRQLEDVFTIKRLTYVSEEDKCDYAGTCLAGTPSQQWQAERKRIAEDPTRSLTFAHFKAFLQENMLPATVRTHKLVDAIYNCKQFKTQSVPELIAHLDELENQADPPYDDRARRDHLYNAIHDYIRRAMLEQNRDWGTRQKLEQVATSLEAALTPPDGITVRRGGYPAPHRRGGGKPGGDKEKATVNAVAGYTGRKRKPGRRDTPAAGPPKTQKTAPESNQPAVDATDYSDYECYNCGQKGHIQKNCPQPKDGAGKVQGQ
ncbi:hypothetical protein MMC07_007792 [Pseudocyphellaria aurata]|nr:hypothetical protein [Pseudocyphellaria aurata]